ncbi:hypothetical protein C8J57DRAFT_1725412 [Mycena rebaudengoi]|nr:hypothetical protein C8J57DRAFT_1725412 [Mycena rebaudengoi]
MPYRASQNAVEKLGRENLFLELASLLPNPANIRRPTKSSIVNNCIPHVHASRRHRFLASQQLRAMRDECEPLQCEANEWCARVGMMPLEAPKLGGHPGSSTTSSRMQTPSRRPSRPVPVPLRSTSPRRSLRTVPPFLTILGTTSTPSHRVPHPSPSYGTHRLQFPH